MELSVKDTCRIVYPFINFTTILKWIQKGFFMPYKHVDRPSGPTEKNMLDPADMVVVAVLHALFRFGAQSKELETERLIWFSEPRKKRPDAKSSFKKAGEGLYTLAGIGRKWQEYLLKHEFKVIVHWAPNVGRNTLISVYPHGDWIDDVHVKEISDDYRPVFGNIFINCDCWQTWVATQLNAHIRRL